MLEWTGERFIPGEGGATIRYEHMHRYSALAGFVSGRRVVDVGCGEGYGSSVLAKSAAAVVGVDVDPDVIAHAEQRYGHSSNLSFRQVSTEKLPFEDATFDVAVCFEVIEHLESPKTLLPELARIAGDDGVLIISTPNKRLYSDERSFRNEFHLHEFYIEEFRDFLLSQFENVRFFGQRILATSFLWDFDSPISAREFEVVFELDPTLPTADKTPEIEPLYIIAVCSQGPIDGISQSFLVTDDQELTNEIDGAVSSSVVRKVLADFEEERGRAQAVLNEWEAELQARARALQAADQEVQYLRRRVKELEDGT